jgi:hypothetical protein
MKNIVNEKINFVKTNHFWYTNSSDDICTFIHKRGKKEGHMCHKRIRINISDEKQDYLCSTHSKKHIPKKRTIKLVNTNVIISDYDYKRKKDVKKIRKYKIKQRKIYVCNGGLLDLSKILHKILK